MKKGNLEKLVLIACIYGVVILIGILVYSLISSTSKPSIEQVTEETTIEPSSEEATVASTTESLNKQITIGMASDFNEVLPIEVDIRDNEEVDYEAIAYRLWLSYMELFISRQESSNITQVKDYRFENFTYQSGDEDSFVVAVQFRVYPFVINNKKETFWGVAEEDGSVRGIYWFYHIEKGDGVYQLVKVEPSTLPAEALDSINLVRYEIQDDILQFTLDDGINWQEAPVTVEQLLAGDQLSNQTELVAGSYILTRDRVAFVIGNGRPVSIVMSVDQGETWTTTKITSGIGSLRFRSIGFTSENDGYAIFSGNRTMSSEINYIYTTNDGGETWQKKSSVDTNTLVSAGNFINKDVGFVSFGNINPTEPTLYCTQDGGTSWQEVTLPVPEEYSNIFVSAEAPYIEDGQLNILVNQGSNGDYQGGRAKALFTSTDNGLNWKFVNVVE